MIELQEDKRTATIAVHGVSKSYRNGTSSTQVLREVDLEVRQGECVFLAGPSGSGKSTLLSIIGCILSADEGEVRLLQHNVHSLTTARRATVRRNHIGFVFQKFHLIRGLTAAENVAVPLILSGQHQRIARQRAVELLAAVGLADKVNSRPRNLSTGQCQRVALARALSADPELILADEPTASLDAESGHEAIMLLRRLTSEQGKTAIVVTHDQRIFPLADRVFMLDGGAVTESTIHQASNV